MTSRARWIGLIAAPYTRLSNPLPRTPATVEHGAKVYAANCASCHDDTGLGDGPGRGGARQLMSARDRRGPSRKSDAGGGAAVRRPAEPA